MTVEPSHWDFALTVVLIAALWFLYKITFLLIQHAMKTAGKELHAPNTLKTILGIFYGIIGIVGIVKIFDLSVTPLMASLGIGGIIVGLALQEPLGNLFAGIFILTTGVVREGEAVGIGDDVSGVVEVVRINHTVIKTYDGRRVIIPNRRVWQSNIVHYWPGEARRLEFTVGIPYGVDQERAVKALWKAIETSEHVVQDLGNNVIFKGFGPSSVDYNVYVWFRRESWGKIQNEIARRIVECLKEEGIEIPYPQLDVHVKREA